MTKLLVVESPAKARTLSSYLGSDFIVLATFGHLVDLPHDRLGIDLGSDFLPEYELLPGKKKVLAPILKAAKQAEHIFIGTDPDREGEFIGSVLWERIGKKSALRRVRFREISKSAVLSALGEPTDLDLDLVESQVARRILDRLIGYRISPFLWKAYTSGTSAGRVQSVALKWICEREEEIRSFVPEDSWEVNSKVRFGTEKDEFVLFRRKEGAFSEEGPAASLAALLSESGARLRVTERKEKKGETLPPPPYTTASLQQDAFRMYKFPAAKTSKLAQLLYEGVDLGRGKRQGLITYMRTDSVRISTNSKIELRKQAALSYGKESVAEGTDSHRKSKGKAKAQDAHEAIRPVDPSLTSEEIFFLSDKALSKDAKKLYELIWKRAVASQMKPERWNQLRFSAEAGGEIWQAEIKRTEFPGYRVVYGGRAEKKPEWKIGESLLPETWKVEKKTTEPSPRYTEATLVGRLEKEGIGRPSTFANILETLYKRKYTISDKAGILSTNLGERVNSILQEVFPDLFREGFTSEMESELDRIAEGSVSRSEVLKRFYSKLESTLKRTDSKSVSKERKTVPKTVLGYGTCPVCGKGVRVRKRSSRKKEYYVCSRFPECDYAEYL
ncbi:type I DNA topoisomerase [Leptospira fletcheri]|uniref:DNA topoisomerase 1 n=1 Tax=Leptospira fletcheri TaxID=2484981 RepID=A0A4R9GF54_9LEPT|nr:type I DNA topoisomerase [Leptospira fletcheri]TGK09910.1 type I DNA topoisomerase [Leptospira fletcheri]